MILRIVILQNLPDQKAFENMIIEEVALKGMPLGAVSDFPYQTQSTELFVGDTLLLLSDGLPELFNKEKEMLTENLNSNIAAVRYDSLGRLRDIDQEITLLID